MTNTDWNEWRLIDSDLETVLGILPASESHLYLALNEPGAGELKIPLDCELAGVVASGQFAQCSYRGAVRGGFFIENISKGQADASEGAGQWVSISGRGALSLLDDPIVWDDGSAATTRDFINKTRAEILITLIDEAQTRGGLLGLTYDFTALLDSAGQSWTDSDTLKLTIGSSLLDIARMFARTGIDFDIQPDAGAFVLSAYKLGMGTDKSETVYLRTGVNCEEVTSDEHGDKIKNALRVAYKDGYVSVNDAVSIVARRRREKLLDMKMAQTSSSATTIGAAELELSKDPKKSISVKIYDGIGARAFIDYDLGDYIMLDVQGVETRYRIYGIQPDWTSQQFSRVIVELNSILYENDIQMAQDVAWLMDQWATAHDADLLEVSFWAAIGTPQDVMLSIYSFLISGNLLYVFGYISVIGGVNVNVGVATYNLDTGVWETLPYTPLTAGYAYCGAMVGTNLYIGHNFYGGLVKYDTIAKTYTGVPGLVDPDPGTYAKVTSMHVVGTDIYLGGQFIGVSQNVARLDTTDDSINSMDGGVNGVRVNAITNIGSTIYVGGYFTEAGSGPLAVGFVAAWNGSVWSDLDGGLDGIVSALVVDGTNIIAGGYFTNYLSTWDGAAWTSFSTSPDGTVLGLAMYLTDLYAVGAFTNIGNRIAKLSGGEWFTLAEGLNDTTNAIILDDTNVIVGGNFTTAGTKPAEKVAIYFNNFEALADYLENSSNGFDMGAAIHNAPASAITDLDEVPFWESVANALRKITWANIKATLFPSANAGRLLLGAPTTGALTSNAKFYYDATYGIINLGGSGGNPSFVEQTTLLNLLAPSDDAQSIQTSVTWGDDAAAYNGLLAYRAGGVKATPTALGDAQIILNIAGLAHDGVAWSNTSLARMLIKTTQAQTATHHGAGIFFDVTPNDSTTRVQMGSITGDGYRGILQVDKDTYRFGFVTNYAGVQQTTIAFDGTNTFTLAPTGTTWDYYRNGIKYTITGSKTVTLSGSPPAAKGMYYVVIDSVDGTLTCNTTPWTLEDTKVPVASIIWDNTLTPKYWLADERHTVAIDRRYHWEHHFSDGTEIVTAPALTGYTVAPASPADANNTFAISESVTSDEDLKHTLAPLADPNGTATDYVVDFRTAAAVWNWEASAMPYRYTAAGYIQYDSSGTMTEGAGNKVYTTYLLLTNRAGAARFTLIHGQAEYSTVAAARSSSFSTLTLTGISIAEFVACYQLIWETSAAYGTKGKARLAVEPIRISISASGAGATSFVVATDATLTGNGTSGNPLSVVFPNVIDGGAAATY